MAARALLALVLPILPGGAEAADDDPTFRNASPGYSSRLRNRTWSPVQIQVINPGPERSGTAIVESEGDRSNLKVATQRTVTLPEASLRTFDVPGYIDMHMTGSRTNRQMMPVILTDGRVQTWSRMETFAGISDERRVIFYCNDPRRLSYRFLDEFRIADDSVKSSRIVGTNKDLPGRPIYYQGIDFVILGVTPKTVINELQAAALRSWVEGGGILIISGSDPSLLENVPDLADLLPVSYLSSRTVEVLPLMEQFGSPFQSLEGIARHRLVHRAGDVLFGTEEDPWVVARQVGLGHVFAVNFDTGNREWQRWDGATQFFEFFAGRMSPFARYGTRILSQGTTLESALGSLTGKEVASRKSVGLYLLGILIVLAGPLFLFRKAKRPEIAWGIAVVAALLAGCGAVGIAQIRKAHPEPTLNEVYVAETQSGKTPWAIQSAVAAYSPHDKVFIIPTPEPSTWWRPSSSTIEPPETLPFEFSGEEMTVHLPVHADDVRYLYWEGSMQRQPAPETRFEIGANGLRIEINDSGNRVLEEMFVKYNRLVVPLGDSVSTPTAIDRSVRPDSGVRSVSYSDKKVLQALDSSRRDILDLLIPKQSGTHAGMVINTFGKMGDAYAHGNPSLYYWSSESIFPNNDESISGKSRGIGLIRVNGGLSYADGKLVFPQGVLPREVVMKQAAVRTDSTGELSGQKATTVVLKWSLPADAPELKVEQATFFAHLEGETYSYELYAVPISEVESTLGGNLKTLSVKNLEKLEGAGAGVVLKDVSRFYEPATRSLYAVMRILSDGLKPAASRTLVQAMRQWQVKNLEVELEGSRL